MEKLVWLIPALPLVGFALLVPFGRRLGERSGWLATALVAGSFGVVVATFLELLSRPIDDRVITLKLFSWIPAGNLKVGMGLLVDPLSVTMCLFITGVGALIHLYSIGYMKGDEKYSKFFLYLNLFVFSMLMLVLGDNLLVTFLGWEGVGACSYFLISFWHTNARNASAGKKAFVTNRIGDWGFMVATFLTWTTVGSINYVDITAAANAGTIVGATAVALGLLFLVAAAGKSAQLPLFVWLPDAMAGPTPVSALIHAATMVTAGVYLLVRLNPVLVHAAWANDVIAWIGVITALVAATIAISQNDIKKVLAYSTISQLGFMFLAVGTGNYVAAIFHMVTHAFFKALLFLGAGSVIHGMNHDQDMRHYGNLRKYLPITAGTFIVGWLAIAGVPPFSGFWSKDEILAGAYNFGSGGKAMWVLALVAALLTAFYMTRQVIMTFFGEEKWRSLPAEVVHGDDDDAQGHHGLTPGHEPYESPWTMTAPLVILAGFAVIGGLMNLPFSSALHRLGIWLEPTLTSEEALPTGATLWVLALVAVAVSLVGIGFAGYVYYRHKLDPKIVERDVFANGWYIDSSYAWFTGGPGRAVFDAIAWFDTHIVDGAVNGVATGVAATGTQLRKVQSGQVRGYALGLAAGAVLMLGYFVTRMGF